MNANSLFVLLIAVVLGGPPLVALAGVVVRREHGFQYAVTAAAAVASSFVLTGLVALATHWTVLGIAVVLAAVAGHVWQFRSDRGDMLIVGGIYAASVGLAVALLLRTLA